MLSAAEKAAGGGAGASAGADAGKNGKQSMLAESKLAGFLKIKNNGRRIIGVWDRKFFVLRGVRLTIVAKHSPHSVPVVV